MKHPVTLGPKHRALYIYNNVIHFKSEDPYGFWRVYLDKGLLPAYIHKNIYTDLENAVKDIMKWAYDSKEEVSTTPIEKTPEPETKQVPKQKKLPVVQGEQLSAAN